MRSPVDVRRMLAPQQPAVTTQRPSLLNAAPATGPKCNPRVCAGRPVRTSHVRASWSTVAVSRSLPFGEKATDVILSLCPANLRRNSPDRASQIRTAPSSAPVASRA
jgi:hypothetical protein